MIEILIPFVAFWFAGVSVVPQSITLLNRKPFVCSKCMGFWIALGYQITIGFNGWQSIIIIAMSSLFAYLIEWMTGKLNIPFNK